MKENVKNSLEAHLSIKDFPQEERPRERLVRFGAASLSDAELLALILKTGRSGENVVDLARRIIATSRSGTLSGVYDMSLEELKQIEGVGQAKAAQIVATCRLAERIATDKSELRKVHVDSIPQLGELLLARLKWLNQEVFEVVMVDSRWNLINTSRISTGSVNQSIVHPREVFLEALRNYSTALVLVHNHPSGNPSPSEADLYTTKRLVAAGRLLGVEVVDHIITGLDSYYSMHLQGDMEKIRNRLEIEKEF